MIRELPAAASVLVQPLLARRATWCPVVAASRTAVHVSTGDPAVPVLSVIAPGGARLPGALILVDPLPAESERAGLLVGDGTVRWDATSVEVRRWWSMPTVMMPADHGGVHRGADGLAAALRRTGLSLPAPVGPAAERLAAATNRQSVQSAVHGLVGLGPGLTPAGDDVLVGALLGWHHLDADAMGLEVASAVRDRLDRTSTVSAALLHHAFSGESVPEALVLLDALRGPEPPDAALASLVAIGHDTGAAMAYGIALALQVVLARHMADRLAG